MHLQMPTIATLLLEDRTTILTYWSIQRIGLAICSSEWPCAAMRNLMTVRYVTLPRMQISLFFLVADEIISAYLPGPDCARLATYLTANLHESKTTAARDIHIVLKKSHHKNTEWTGKHKPWHFQPYNRIIVTPRLWTTRTSFEDKNMEESS